MPVWFNGAKTNKVMKKIIILSIIASVFSCKQTDPFVDRVTAPVLVVFQNANGSLTNGLTTEPTISTPAAEDAKIIVKLYELDKTNILDFTKGIDSVAVKSLPITIKLRNGNKVSDITTDATGKSVLTTTWASLGVATPVAGSTSVSLSLSSTYKSVPFTKFFRLTASK
jgi:hypothetical protein